MPATVAPTTATVLHTAASWLAYRPYTRMVRTDVHHALWQAAAQEYDLAQTALETLAAHLRGKGLEAWLCCWSKPRSRDELVAELHEAADATEHARAVHA